MASIGERIRLLRRERGFSQMELAAKAGVRQSQVSSWERSEYVPSSDVLARVAQALGTSLDYLVFNEQRAADGLYDPDLLRVLREAEKLSADDKAILRDVVEVYVKRCLARQKKQRP